MQVRIDLSPSVNTKLEGLVADKSVVILEQAVTVVVLVHVSDAEVPRELREPEGLTVFKQSDAPLDGVHDSLEDILELNPVCLIYELSDVETETLLEAAYQVPSEDFSA